MKGYTPDPADLATIYHGPTRVWVSGPSVVAPGERFDLRVSLLRVDGYLATEFVGELAVMEGGAFDNLPERLAFSPDDQGSITVPGCSISAEGIHRFGVEPVKGSFPAGACHPIWVRKGFPYRLYWGDLHVHTTLGKCGTPYLPKSPDFGYWFARDVLGHDYCAAADHAHALTDDGWAELTACAARWHEPGKFVSVLGFEGDYDGEDGGHFNLYFPGDRGEYRDFSRQGETLDAMFEFARKHQGLAICHHSGRKVASRDFAQSHFGGAEVEPVMEVYSQWGSSEEYASSRPIIEGRHPGEGHYYRYALKHGYRLGVTGGSDSHCTTPGGAAPMAYPQWGGKPFFPYPGGVGAIYATELTRAGLFEALRARRCYATSLEKILLWTEAHGAPMGSEIAASCAEIEILAACTYGPLTEVVVVKDGEVVDCFGEFGKDEGFDRGRRSFRLLWRDEHFARESCYYVRATTFDCELAWSSPIWIRPE